MALIIDAHIHWPVGKNMQTGRFLELLDAHGIERAVLSGIDVYYKVGPVAWFNDRLADFCRAGGERLRALGAVHLAAGPEAVEAEARHCLDRGLRGFKLHPWLQGETLFQEAMEAVCRVAAGARVPIMFHDGTPPYALCSQIAMLAAAHPDNVFILGHAGILHYWAEAAEAARQCPNLRLVLCGGHPAGLRELCRRVAPDRILWGSDYFGEHCRELISYQKGVFDRLGLADADRRRILWDNPLALYWGPAPPAPGGKG